MKYQPANLTKSDSKWTKTLFWLMPFLTVLLFRMPYFGLQVMNSDEGLYASVARAMQLGGIPYQDAWDHAAPGIFYLYRLAFSIFGDWNMSAVRMLALVAHTGSALIIGFEIRKSYGLFYGTTGAIMVASAIGAYLPSDVIAALTETFMLPPLLYVAVILMRWGNGGSLNTILTGTLCAIAVWFKIHALVMILSLLLGSTIARSIMQKSLLDDLILCTKILFIALSAYVILIMPILTRGGGPAYWTLYIKYNIYYMQAGKYDEYFLIGLVKTLLQWSIPNLVLLSLAVFGVYFLLKEKMSYGRGIFFLSGLFAGILIGTAGARLFGHYFIPLFAFLGWVAGEGIIGFSNTSYIARMSKVKKLFMNIFLTNIIVFMPLFYFHSFAYQSRIEMIQKGIKMGNKFPLLVDKIHEVTTPEDNIWVWGFAPEIYVSAKRDCANRFINCNYLVGLIPWVNVSPKLDTSAEALSNSWKILKADLRNNPPEIIVDVSVANYQFWGKYPLSSRPALNNYVKSNYKSIGNFNNFSLYKKVNP